MNTASSVTNQRSVSPNGDAGSRQARTNWWALLAVAGCSLAVRLAADILIDPAISADEGPVGQMARHILRGELPVFYYGQAYLGSQQAFLAALLFALFGASTATLRLAPLLSWSGYIVLTGWLAGKIVGQRMGVAAALLAALASPLILFHAHLALGGIGAEVLLVGSALGALSYHIAHSDRLRHGNLWFLAFGLLSGWALWVDFLSVVYVLACAIYIVISYGRRSWRQGLRLLWCTPLGLLLGLAPVLAWNAQHSWATFAYLEASLTGKLPHAATPAFPQKLVEIATGGLTMALGGRNDWDGWLSMPWQDYLPVLSGVVIAFYALCALCWLVWRWRQPTRATAKAIDLVWMVAAVNLLLFANMSFQDEGPVVRYLLPLAAVLPIAAVWLGAQLRQRSRLLWGLALGVLLVHNGYFSALLLTSGTSYPIYALDRWLESAGVSRVYAGYWIQWPLVFASDERVIASPRYGPAAGDRYPEYTAAVDAGPNPVFVFDRQEFAASRFAVRMAEMGIAYRLDVVGGRFLVYSCFSRDPRTEPIWP